MSNTRKLTLASGEKICRLISWISDQGHGFTAKDARKYMARFETKGPSLEWTYLALRTLAASGIIYKAKEGSTWLPLRVLGTPKLGHNDQ